MKFFFAFALIFVLFVAVRSMVIEAQEAEGNDAEHAQRNIVKRAIDEEMFLQYAEEKADPNDSQCCMCGTHQCCGSMCHGRK